MIYKTACIYYPQMKNVEFSYILHVNKVALGDTLFLKQMLKEEKFIRWERHFKKPLKSTKALV